VRRLALAARAKIAADEAKAKPPKTKPPKKRTVARGRNAARAVGKVRK
jgi:hypothetical protein